MPTSLGRLTSKVVSLAKKELAVVHELRPEALAALRRMRRKDPGLKALLADAHAHAIFPSVGKASALLGAAFGKGAVFRQDELIGYAAVVQLTVGLQLGGDTYTQIIVFRTKAAFDRFKAGTAAFAANASAVLVKVGAAASAPADRDAVVFIDSEGGLMLELAVGAQKFFFVPAVLGRATNLPAARVENKSSRSAKASHSLKSSRKGRPARSRAAR